MKNARFNASGDLLIELSFMQNAIAIDDDFHLQVAAPGKSDLDGKWLKVETNANNSPVILVSNQTDGTLFQLDDGDLVVDQQSRPTGSRAITRPLARQELADILFVTSETFKSSNERSEKLECTTTGSNFDYSFGDKLWWKSFTLDQESGTRVQLFKGDSEHPGSFKVFEVKAVY